jgi:hypothetical protein
VGIPCGKPAYTFALRSSIFRGQKTSGANRHDLIVVPMHHQQ